MMDKQKLKDLVEYVGSFLSVLFLALKNQFDIIVVNEWVDVTTTFLTIVIISWGIWHNKHLFIDKSNQDV